MVIICENPVRNFTKKLSASIAQGVVAYWLKKNAEEARYNKAWSKSVVETSSADGKASGIARENLQSSFFFKQIMEKSTSCDHTRTPVRNYRNVPRYEIQTLSRSPELEFIASTIESVLCRLGFSGEDEIFMDQDAARLLELFFDEYHFNDTDLQLGDRVQDKGYQLLNEVIDEDLSDIPKVDLIRVMSSIYAALQRRTQGGDEYLRFINEYSGD